MSDEVTKICFDRLAPDQRADEPARTRPHDGGLEAVIPDVRNMWPNGQVLTVSFMGGTAAQHDLVKQHSTQWEAHANLTFDFVDDPAALIRVSFDPNLGAWSYLGTVARRIPLNEATLNLGWVDEGVILHEFGHAIGLGHEHQNPAQGIEWNEEVVLRELGGPPNNWDEAKARHNVLNKYSLTHLRGSEFDPDSVMLYFFPGSWVKSGIGTPQNEVLSAQDKAFISGIGGYPKNAPSAKEIQVGSPIMGAIGTGGERDFYAFQAQAGQHVVETSGKTDVVMSLYGPNNPTDLLAENDDGGTGLNSKVVIDLTDGTYYIELRHYNTAAGTGRYGIGVNRS